MVESFPGSGPGDHVGRACPYCQAPLKPGVEVTVCPACEMPHHSECWAEGGGCTTWGCEHRGAADSPGSPGEDDGSGARAASGFPRLRTALLVGTIAGLGLFFLFARLPRNGPSPPGNNGISNGSAASFSLSYRAGEGGRIEGITYQEVVSGGSGAAVEAMPSPGYRFTGWSDGEESARRQDAEVRSDLAVTAGFGSLEFFVVEYLAGEGGEIEGVTRQELYLGVSGSEVEAVPLDGYLFTGWSDGAEGPRRRERDVGSDITVTARFTPRRYVLSYAAGPGGEIRGRLRQETGHSGTGSEVEAVPLEGHLFTGWSDGAEGARRLDRDVREDVRVTANFSPLRYSLAYEAGPGGRIEGEVAQEANFGTSGREVSAVPEPGHEFSGWSDGVTDARRRDRDVRSDISVTADFRAHSASDLTRIALDRGGGEIIAGDGAPMVLVPAGEFLMGSPEWAGQENERPARRVQLDDYYLDRYPVTVARYRAFCEATGRAMPPAPAWGWQDNHPVVNLTWHDANAYAEYYGKRLPTEAEWEKAARGGTETLYFFGDSPFRLGEYAWFRDNSGRRTRPVGERRPNPLGIHDLYGNVLEWCSDWYAHDYYAHAPPRNPGGPVSGNWKVLRGGSWDDSPDGCRSASRTWFDPGSFLRTIGFRCAVSVNR